MNEDHIRLLQGMPIFGGITDDALEFLLEHARVVFVHAGDYVVREGERGDSMFVIERGQVEVVRAWKGRDCALGRLGPGDIFGEMELIDLRPRSASVVAVEDCTAIEISARSLHELYRFDLEPFAMIHMNMGREVSRRLRDADDRLFHAKVEAEENTV